MLTDRPSLRTSFPKRPEPTTELPTTVQRLQTTNSRFSTAGRPASPLAPATTEAPRRGSLRPEAPVSSEAVGADGLPAPKKAAPGPNGEEYYYYYYYYDDEDNNEVDAAPGS